MSKFFKNLAMITALFGVLTAPIFITGSVSAVDIFSSCSSDLSVDKGSCADCDGKAKNSDVCKDVKTQNGSSSNPIISIIKAAIDIVSKIVGIAAIISVLASGMRMITANGDGNAVSTARTGLVYALIGVAVAVLAQAIVVFVLKDVN